MSRFRRIRQNQTLYNIARLDNTLRIIELKNNTHRKVFRLERLVDGITRLSYYISHRT